jgi:uncharacterized protein YtpQ (UPF0354 family)
MSWRKIASGLCSTLVLVGCGGQQAPTAEHSGQPAASSVAVLEGGAQKASRARLRAVIRDQAFLDHLSESVRAATISEPFSGRMVILYMVDDGGAARGAQAADLADSGITRDALRAVVEWNMAGLLETKLSCTSHAVTEPAHHDYYESSRLLLDRQWADLAARAGTVVVAAPSNDTLFVACNPTPDILQKLSVVVQNTYPQATRQVSPSLLTWGSEGWKELPVP